MIKESLEKSKDDDYDYSNNKGTYGFRTYQSFGIHKAPRTFVYLHTDHYYYNSFKFDGHVVKIE